MDAIFAAVPPVHPDCRVSVTIPARDEAALVERTLAAFAAQRGVDGSPLPANFFEIIVFANSCTDETAKRARSAAKRFARIPLHVVEARLSPPEAHVGMARKLVMDFAAARQCGIDARHGIVASADADTIVDEAWIAWLARESHDVDAVAGHVTVCETEQAAMHAPVRLLYVRELAFRRILAEVEAWLDPRAEDPAPRHASFVGASFGVKAQTYLAVGGMVPVPRLEDYAFSQALRRIDARIRHSLRMRATTSARVGPRVEGGFGTFVADLVERGRRRDTFYVEPADFWLESFAARAALRRIWHDAGTQAEERIVTRKFGLEPDVWLRFVDRDRPFGEVHARIEKRAANTQKRYAPVPVEDVIVALRDAAISRKAATPTRTSAASGAG